MSFYLEYSSFLKVRVGDGNVASISILARLVRPVARRARNALLASVCAAALLPGAAHAISLKSAIKIMLEANPEIGEAIARREAIEFELSQARGLYAPSIDGELRNGVQRLDSPGTRFSGTSDDDMHRRESRLNITQNLFSGFNRRGERHNHAARVDASSHRIYERSEFIGLNVVRLYLEVGRQMKIVQFADDNLAYHKRIYGDLKEGQSSGSISVADTQQAEERVFSAEARVVEANEELNGANIRFLKLVGKPLDNYQDPGSVVSFLPRTLPNAIGTARTNNPLIKIAKADLDAARALITKARSQYYPKLDLEVQGRAGRDLDGVHGREEEVRAELVLRWNLFRGGIDRANVQEQVRVTDGERYGLRRAHREVEEQVRLAWNRQVQQRRRYEVLKEQLASTERLIESYAEQFKVGDRSLLDLLDTQNTRFNTQVSVETARSALEFAEYRVLASTGKLLNTLHIEAPLQSETYARVEHRVPETPDGDTNRRMKPSHRWWFTGRSR